MAMLGMKYDSETGNRGRTQLRKLLGIKDEGEEAPWVGPNKRSKIIDFFNTKAVGDGGRAYGIAQWHPDRQANFRRFAGKDIRESTLEEQLSFIHHELTRGSEQIAGAMLRKTSGAGEAAAVVSKFYERPANVEGEMADRGGLAQKWYDASLGTSNKSTNATINQKTDIHVQGGEAASTAKKVADEQGTVNAEIVRNMGAVTR